MVFKHFHRQIILSLALLFISTAAFAQNQDAPKQKLAPFFQQVVEQQGQKAKAVSGDNATFPSNVYTASVKSNQVFYNAIIYTRDPAKLRSQNIRVNSVYDTFVTAQVTASQLSSLRQINEVSYVSPGGIHHIDGDNNYYDTNAHIVSNGFINGTNYKGKDVIVLVFDTGIDWQHADFKKSNGDTRIMYLWDQTIQPQSGEGAPSDRNSSYSCCTEGVEYSSADINSGDVRSEDTNGHGTHVAGIAAGNDDRFTGIAPEADIVVVKGGNGSFSETREINAIQYAAQLSNEYDKPVVVNFSLGGQSSAHDGSAAAEVAINNFSDTPGQVAVVAAGNEGGDAIHLQNSFSSGTSTITFNVPDGYSGDKDSYVSLNLYWPYNSVTAKITTPSGYTKVLNEGENGSITNKGDGNIFFQNANINGKWNVYLNVSSYKTTSGTYNYPASGTWTLELSNPNGKVDYHAWLGASMGAEIDGGDSKYTVGSPGTAKDAITVGAHITRLSWHSLDGNYYGISGQDSGLGELAGFSSHGPTVDGRTKPDITAPGQVIISSLSSQSDADSAWVFADGTHRVNLGTSMATPHVAGAVALLLSETPGLRAGSIKQLLHNGANTTDILASLPNNDWGYGRLDIANSFMKIHESDSKALTDILSYDGPKAAYTTLSSSNKYAVRFTAAKAGTLSSVLLDLTLESNNAISGTGPLVIEAYTDAGGKPSNTQIGKSITVPFDQLYTNFYNFIDVSDMNVNVSAGQDFHIVLSTSSGSSLGILMDDGANATNRTSYFDGSQWNTYGPDAGQSQYRNLHMRAEILSTEGTFTDIPSDQITEQPMEYSLQQNYPNPFNPTTSIQYSLPQSSKVTLTVYSIQGRKVMQLVGGQQQSAGMHRLTFDASHLASGVYLYRLKANGVNGGQTFEQTRKMTLIK